MTPEGGPQPPFILRVGRREDRVNRREGREGRREGRVSCFVVSLKKSNKLLHLGFIIV